MAYISEIEIANYHGGGLQARVHWKFRQNDITAATITTVVSISMLQLLKSCVLGHHRVLHISFKIHSVCCGIDISLLG